MRELDGGLFQLQPWRLTLNGESEKSPRHRNLHCWQAGLRASGHSVATLSQALEKRRLPGQNLDLSAPTPVWTSSNPLRHSTGMERYKFFAVVLPL